MFAKTLMGLSTHSNNHLMMSYQRAYFASQFTRLDRSLDKFDPSVYSLPKTDQSLLV